MTGQTVLRRVFALACLALLGGCTEQQPAQELRSLSGSEDAVFLCRAASGVGHPYSDCPDRNADDDENLDRQLSVMALVTQTLTDEVAVVNVTAGHVIDVDPSTPGYGFLRVGGRPVSMAATPGGAATFVATADAGRNGIFALPTSKLAAPATGSPSLDLTTWSACRLDETPGEIAVVVDAAGDCSDEPAASFSDADVVSEGGPPGRRVLLVSFPDRGVLRVYDAQTILNGEPGAFAPCQPIGEELQLQADVPAGVAQTLPADLVPADSCTEVPAPVAPTPSKRSPRPAGFAQADGRLYVADLAAPVIHVLDLSAACHPAELAPLLPMSLREPERVVTTRRLAVSPLTPALQRFVYAIDAEDQPASVMVFDVSPGSTDPTPLVRPGSPELAGEKPDRLAFGANARDVTFAYRDIPYVDESTGAAEFGVRCSPNPAIESGPQALARPNADYTVGARPGLLRGLFGFVLLTDGRVAIVDVDDFDADCRRPVTSNTSSTPDVRGCVGDAIPGPYVSSSDGLPLVTNEISCRVIEPHRPRSAQLALNNSVVGIRAPSLRSFPQLTPAPGEAATAPEDRPRLLAVPFAADDGEQRTDVYVGSTLYSNDAESGADPLPVDPNSKLSDALATQNSVVLPPLEPRAYASSDTVTLTYEGALGSDRVAGFLNEGELRDDSLSFCSAGVYDPAAMADYAAKELGLSTADAETFGASHADYVQLVTAFPDEDDSYWTPPKEDSRPRPPARSECVTVFGEADAQTLLTTRDLLITSAFADHLVVEPRDPSIDPALFKGCFPTAQKYRLRGGKQWIVSHSGSFRHDVVASGADSRCVRSCNPLYKWQRGRVFEVSSSNCREPGDPDTETPEQLLSLRVGCARADDLACVYRQNDDAYQSLLGTPAESCVFNGLTERFAVYRGRQDSVRDAAFTWQTTGGFTPLQMGLANLSTVVSPQSIQFLAQPEQLAVVDGASQGLSLFSLDTFGVVKPTPFY